MKIAFNPSTVAALIAPPNNKDITFDLRGHNIFARGVKFCGTDTNTWRDIKINNVSIDSNILDLRDGDNTTLTNINGIVTINSTWRPVVDNLTSDSTTSSLSANLGRILKALIDGKSDSDHNHDDRYLRLTGGWMSGDINFGDDNKIYWGRNTDSASISFKNDGDGDADSYMSFVTSDNGNEYFRWSHSSGSTNTEWMSLRSDGLRVGGTKVSLEGHSHNDLYYTKTEVNSKLNDKSDTSHTHDDRYLKLTGGTISGTIYRNSGGVTISGRDHAIIRLTYAPGGSSWNPIACVDTETGTWTLGHLSSGDSDTNFHFCFSTNTDYNAGNNNGNYVTLRNKVGTIALLSEIPDKNSWNYDDRYLKLTGGTMNGNARIGYGSGNLYIGNSGNDGWVAVQDICSQDAIGDGKWSIRVDGTAHFQSIKFPYNRCISQVESGSNSPLKGIKLPDLQSNGIGMFSKLGDGGGADEGGIIISADTSVIYNSFDTGWGLSVRDKDINLTDISGDNTIAFGIRQDYRAYSLGGFEKSGSDNSYVLLGGGGHKLESSLNVANADTVDNYHIADESRQVYRNYYTVDNPAGAWILIKLPAWNANNEIVAIDGYGDNRQSHCVVHCGSRYQGLWGYQSDYNGTVVDRIRWKEVDSGKFAIVALINGGITTLTIKATNSLEISKTTADNAAFAISSSFFSSGGVFYGNAASATKLQTPRTLWYRNTFDGANDVNGVLCINTSNASGNFDEGIRILNKKNGWVSITMCGTDAGDSLNGTSNNTWAICNENGNFYITKRGSSNGQMLLGMTSNKFRIAIEDSLNGGIASSLVNYSNNSPYGLLTRIYNTGVVSLQSLRESNNGELFGLSLLPLGGNVGIGTNSPTEKLHINNGLIKIEANSRYLRIGPQNSSHAHYETNADVSHWFNKRVDVNGAIWRYGSNYGIDSDGHFYAKGVYANRDGSQTLGGVSLYSTSDPMTYGIALRGTGTYGTHGYVTSANDWATYLTMNDDTTRGWIFRRGDTNVASIAGSGNMAIGLHLEFSNGAHISTNRSTDYHYGYTFNLGDNTKSIGMYSGPVGEAGGVVISPDGCLIYNSSDCGYNLQVRDKDLGSDLTNIATLTFGIELSGYYAWSRGGFKKNGSGDSYVLLGGGGHQTISSLSVNYANSAGNADTVDGYHASSFVRAGHYESADLNKLDTYSFIRSVNSQVSSTSPKGDIGWYNVILLVHRNGDGDGPGYIGLIALGMTTNIGGMFYRTKYNGSWYAWHEVVTTNTGLLRYSRNNVNISSPNCSPIPPSLLEWTIGYPRLYDPEFNEGYNNVYVYNNAGNGVVTVTRVHDTNVGNSSSYIIKVVSAVGAIPNYGGWHVATLTELGKVYTCLFRASIPSGVEIEWNSNSIGTGGLMSWLTNNMGTGKWTWYAVLVYCGSGGSTTFYFSAKSPCTWYLSYVNVIENNRASYAGLRSVYSDYLKANASIVFGRNELLYFNQYTSVTTGATNNANPKTDWYHILRMNHANSSGYFVDLAIPFHDNRILFRRITNGSDNGWSRVITEEPNHNVLLCDGSGGGSVGIGISSPSYKLHVAGDIYSSSSIRMGNISLEHTDEINNSANGSIYLNYRNSGNVSLCQGGGSVGIGTTTPTQRLDVVGNIRATGQIIREGHSTVWILGRDVALLRETTAPGYHTLWSLKTTNGSWDFGEYNTSGWNNVPVLSYITDSNYNSGNNATTYQIKFPLASGTVALTSYGGDSSHPIFLGYLNLDHGNDGTVSSSFSCLGYTVPFTYTRGGNYCRIYIPDTSYQTFYIRAAIASVNYSGGGMDTWVGDHRGDGAWWLHCYASGLNEVRVKGFCLRNSNNDSWWGGNPLWSGSSGANRITVCIFGNVTIR